MKKILSLAAVLGLLSFAGCGGGDATTTLQDAVNSLEAGQAVADAPSYTGGAVPHKIGYTPGFGEGKWDFIPNDWVAASVSELQLYLKLSTTETPTGRRENYNFEGTVKSFELSHKTETYTLLEAASGTVVSSKVIEGTGQFPPYAVLTQNTVTDGIDSGVQSSVAEWLRPFVER